MKPCLAQVSTLNSPFEKDVEDYAAGQCRAMELWLGKLDAYLESHTLDEVQELLERHELACPVASFQGGLLTSQGDQRREHWDSFARRLDVCRQLGVETLVIAGDIRGPLTQQDLDRVSLSLSEAAQQAGRTGLRLALEFQAQSTFGNNIQTAAALVQETGSPHLGICLDMFHFYCGPSKLEDFAFLSPSNLFHVQMCDIAGTARELATDADRVLPGDGDFQLQVIIDHLRRLDYPGYVSIELMNPAIWQVPALQFGEIAITSLRKLLGQASMG